MFTAIMDMVDFAIVGSFCVSCFSVTCLSWLDEANVAFWLLVCHFGQCVDVVGVLANTYVSYNFPYVFSPSLCHFCLLYTSPSPRDS